MTPSVAVTVLLLVSLATAAREPHPLSDEFISLINSQQNSWKAGRNFPKDTPMSYIKNLMGVIKNGSMSALPVKVHDADLIASLPEHFDAREKWPNCPSLNEIRDQGNCGSDWASAAAEAMTDRWCIFSNDTKQFHFSTEDIISCIHGKGCNGGDPVWAWYAWYKEGIVSGGSYNSSEGCMPYIVPPCSHDPDSKNPCKDPVADTPKCIPKCRAGYNVQYEKDKKHGKNHYTLEDEDQIKAELFENGPVQAIMRVFQDFLHYKSGVYVYNHGFPCGLLGVKMLGWGVEEGKKYWLVANSWNTDWGDKGYFKILRGKDECGIEELVLAGEPALDGV